ncbi:MAG TPA: DUF1343 domain-containing protein [Thermomicrobiales bacterium]|nr:DUF1343 domain-containing protein [Thermomicrobiales bacterium]
MIHVQTGAERALSSPEGSLLGARIGLVANPSSIDGAFGSIVTRMAQHPQLDLVALYGPEHGVRGEAQAGEKVAGGVDTATGLPTFSMYGETQVPSPEMLEPIDVLVIDLQDIGVRYTTYLSTVANVMDACAAIGVGVKILDRPNPFPGQLVSGNLLEPRFTSFVGCHTMPILHGLTIGEFGRLYARDKGLPTPDVTPMEGWSRELWYDQCGLPWVLPSPNLPTLDSVTAYPATCLIEGTVLSEGRGTTRPFEFVGAPFVDPERLAAEMNSHSFPGVAFRPVWFQPSFSKHAGTVCGGVQVHVTDRETLDSVPVGVHLLATLRTLYPDDFAWLQPTGDRYFIDLLAGTDRLRKTIDTGGSVEDLLADWNQDANAFRDSRSDILLYD